MYHKLLDIFKANLSEDKGVVFVGSGMNDKFVSYQQVYNHAIKILHNLQRRGIRPGQEAIFQIEDTEQMIYVMWACIMGKIVSIPVPVGNLPEQKLRILRMWRIMRDPCLITTRTAWSSLEASQKDVEQQDIFEAMKPKAILVEELQETTTPGNILPAQLDDTTFIMYSSGSTGEPKGVVVTHRSLLSVTSALIDRLAVTSQDVPLHFMPLTHVVGIAFCHFLPIMTGTTQYLMPNMLFLQNPASWLNKASQYKATFLLAPNFGMRHFLTVFKPEMGVGWDLSHVRIITTGGEAISPQLAKAFVDTLKSYGIADDTLCPVYGVTEVMVAACGSANEGLMAGTFDRKYLGVGDKVRETNEDGLMFAELGRPLESCDVRICDEQDRVLNEGVVGHIQAKGDSVMPCYHNNQSATDKAFTTDGWFQTGDLGFIRNGRLTITGRAKEIIVINAQNYYLFDIERVAESAEGSQPGSILACAIFDNKTMHEEAILFILYTGDLEEFISLAANVQKQVNKRIGLNIRYVLPAAQIPRTPFGKFNRQKMTQMYENGEFDSVITAMEQLAGQQLLQPEPERPMTETEEKLQAIWTHLLGVKETIGVDDNFFEMGGQSLTVAKLVEKVSNEFGVVIEFRTVFETPTIRAIADAIETQKSSQ